MQLLVLILFVALSSSESASNLLPLPLLHRSVRSENVDASIEEIFGNKTVKPSTESATSTTTGTSSTSETSLASEDNAPCRCVPFFLCSEVIPPDYIDIHGDFDECPESVEICCAIKAIASSE